jgi:hypothetical protein
MGLDLEAPVATRKLLKHLWPFIHDTNEKAMDALSWPIQLKLVVSC